MNLAREKAIEAMDTLTAAGYSAHIEAAMIRTELFYRVSVPALHFDSVDLRALCDLAEGIGLECRYQLQAIRFWPRDDELRQRRAMGGSSPVPGDPDEVY